MGQANRPASFQALFNLNLLKECWVTGACAVYLAFSVGSVDSNSDPYACAARATLSHYPTPVFNLLETPHYISFQ